jgi:hypothetical protein
VYCGKGDGVECHHIVKRRRLLLRYDWRNGIPLCPDCHRELDSIKGRAWISRVVPWHDFLSDMERVTIKEYLAVMGLTDDEWRRKMLAELKAKCAEELVEQNEAYQQCRKEGGCAM